MTSIFACIYPVARDAAILLLVGLTICLVIWLLLRRHIPWVPFVVGSLLILLAFWLGSYRMSPLGFSSGRIALLRGFWITRLERVRTSISPRQAVSLASGSAMAIEPQLLPGPVDCMWASSNGGAFDDPASCDTAYSPGQGAAFDVIRVRVRSACSLPPAVGEIRISILPP